MTLTAFVGPLLIGVGPLAVLFAAVVARKSFLVLLSFVRCGWADGQTFGHRSGVFCASKYVNLYIVLYVLFLLSNHCFGRTVLEWLCKYCEIFEKQEDTNGISANGR